jgi:hypothetical protein
MITLTSAQEAAFNAAGEALADIKEATGISLVLMINETGAPERSFGSFNHRGGGDTIHGSGATVAEAVQSLSRQLEKQKDAPRKLRTAAEAVEAVRGLLNEEDPLRAKLDELPIA